VNVANAVAAAHTNDLSHSNWSRYIKRNKALLPHLSVMDFSEKCPGAAPPSVEPKRRAESTQLTDSELMSSMLAAGNDPPLPLPHTYTRTQGVLSAKENVEAAYAVQ